MSTHIKGKTCPKQGSSTSIFFKTLGGIFPLLILLLLGSKTDPSQAQSLGGATGSTAASLANDKPGLSIGGYGQVDYNQPLEAGTRRNGKLDVHRFVSLIQYRFNEKTHMVTEIEYEHVSEVYIEQAYLEYRINEWMNIRAGLLLVPMGIINQYHEPTSFHGTERPVIDHIISPTTWREIGIGISGNLQGPSIRYQAYIMNGFNGYDEKGNLNGKDGLRKGRQKGAESYLSAPSFAGRLEYYGQGGFTPGISGYWGPSQSSLYEGLQNKDKQGIATADSSVVGISMLGADFRYSRRGWHVKGQVYWVGISNSDTYNQFTGNGENPNDLGSAMSGYYLEAGYNLLRPYARLKSALTPFVRWEAYDTHRKVAGSLTRNPAYRHSLITSGITWAPAPGSVFKADIQYDKSREAKTGNYSFNAGIGFSF
jgi:hypothetical protein